MMPGGLILESMAQLTGVLAVAAAAFTFSLAVFFVLKMTVGIRVSEEEEYEGVDLSECGMEAYPELKSQ